MRRCAMLKTPVMLTLAVKREGCFVSDIDRNQFEYKLIGNGEQNVVFLNGFRMNFDSWNKVYPNISKDHRVLIFNRHGVGSSSNAVLKQTGEVVVEDIHKLLLKLNLRPPFLFVAHSIGGIFANLFARIYPNDVSGVVFIDAPHPLEVAEQKQYKPPFIVRAINDGLKNIERIFDKLKYSEDECIEETVSQIQNADSFPNVPIAVVTGTKKMPFVPEEAFKVHQRYQSKLLGLSKYSRHYLCNKSGHFPQVTEPEIVIAAIIDTANETKNS